MGKSNRILRIGRGYTQLDHPRSNGQCSSCKVSVNRPQLDKWNHILCEECSGTKEALMFMSAGHKRPGGYRLDDDPMGYQANAYRDLEECRGY